MTGILIDDDGSFRESIIDIDMLEKCPKHYYTYKGRNYIMYINIRKASLYPISCSNINTIASKMTRTTIYGPVVIMCMNNDEYEIPSKQEILELIEYTSTCCILL